MSDSLVEFNNISKFFGSVIAQKVVTMNVKKGQIMCLLGDNGAGKSTLIKTLSGVHKPNEGEIIVEGKKTIGYELGEQLDWKLPDAIIYPTGGGTGIVGFWKSFQEMECMDWIDTKRPRMYSVQSDGCAPIVRAFNRGDEFAEPWENANTIASGMRVPKAIGDYLMLRVLKESRGGGVTVSDEEILSSVREIFVKEGIFACPEGAATLSALKKLLESGTILPHETVLLLNTGSSIKYLDVLV